MTRTAAASMRYARIDLPSRPCHRTIGWPSTLTSKVPSMRTTSSVAPRVARASDRRASAGRAAPSDGPSGGVGRSVVDARSSPGCGRTTMSSWRRRGDGPTASTSDEGGEIGGIITGVGRRRPTGIRCPVSTRRWRGSGSSTFASGSRHMGRNHHQPASSGIIHGRNDSGRVRLGSVAEAVMPVPEPHGRRQRLHLGGRQVRQQPVVDPVEQHPPARPGVREVRQQCLVAFRGGIDHVVDQCTAPSHQLGHLVQQRIVRCEAGLTVEIERMRQ